MSNATLEAIEQLLDGMLDKKLEPIQKTLAQHTAALEQLLTEKKQREENKDVSTERLDRVESAIKQLAAKTGLKLDW